MTDKMEPLADLAPRLGLSPAALYQAGCRNELRLVRVAGKWTCSSVEAERYADTRLAGGRTTSHRTRE